MARARYQRSPITSGGRPSRHGIATHRPTLIAATKVTTAVTRAMVHSGSAQRTDQPSWSTSRPVRVSRSPEPADSTTPTGSASVLRDEVLAQLGQHLLAEHLAHVARVAGEHRLGDQEARQHRDDPVDVANGGAFLHGLDEVADQPRRRQSGQRGEDVQHQRTPEHPGVLARDGAGVAAYGPAVRDRELRVIGRRHEVTASDSRVTTIR